MFGNPYSDLQELPSKKINLTFLFGTRQTDFKFEKLYRLKSGITYFVARYIRLFFTS